MRPTWWKRGPARRQLVRRARDVLVLGLAGFIGVGVAGDSPEQAASAATVQTFVSRPDLQPPALDVGPSKVGPKGRYVFVAPWRGPGQAGPMILDHRGRMVWFRPMPGDTMAMNFQVQRYRHQPVLTWWQGVMTEQGFGKGEYVVFDRSYHQIARFRPGGHPGDMHEFQITPRGTALVTVYHERPFDLSAVGGPADGTLLDSMVKEVDIDTGRVLFTWRASEHIRLQESHEEVPDDPDEAYDFAHLNAVEVDSDGNLLISARHTDTIYKVDRDTGRIIWRLGGTNSDFTLGPGARFGSQHDVRRHRDGTLTLFDNSDPPQIRDHSRALRLRLHPATMRATVVEQRSHPAGLLSVSQGSVQALPDGGFFVAWGSNPYISRFGDHGRLLFNGRFPDDTDVYRAFVQRWRGHAPGRPAIDVESADGSSVTVFASWNGATRIGRWQVVAGPSAHRLRPVGSTPWQGFETSMTVPTRAEYVAVRAVSRSGQVLARSPAVPAN